MNVVTTDQLYDVVMNKARSAGAVYPTLGESTDPENKVVVVDTETGRVWTVEVEELK